MTNGLSLEELMKEGTYPEEYTEGENWKILHGDTLKLVKAFQPGIFDAVITDPPYASGGTKQNERNRTTNQKYSSMSAANALPDFDGDNKDQRSWTHWMAEWLYDVRKACKKGAPICLFIDWRQYPSITDALQWAGWIWRGIGTVQGELTIMRIFSEYLQKEYSKIKSCSEIDREVLEEFLIHLSTKDTSHSANSSYVISLRRQLETIGKIYSYERLEHLFINTDIPPEVNAEFRVYSDDEMKRLNAEITQMDVQIARCLLIHQMLGTRISDTLTLRPDCLTRENGQDMIEIYQVKTKRYKKPISKELAKLLQSSIEYTQEKFGDTEYIFVNEKEPDRPMQYMAIKTKVMSMIQEKQLKDDHGELFGFGTHMFRHYYGVKLTEMHLDDWTIARLLGHKRLNNVQHYRKMSNQRMADETREVRQRMSDIIYMSLARWGEEYEQIRQDAGIE